MINLDRRKDVAAGSVIARACMCSPEHYGPQLCCPADMLRVAIVDLVTAGASFSRHGPEKECWANDASSPVPGDGPVQTSLERTPFFGAQQGPSFRKEARLLSF